MDISASPEDACFIILPETYVALDFGPVDHRNEVIMFIRDNIK